MNVSIRFEDLFTLQQNLQWEFRNAENEININHLKKIILDSFKQAADKLQLQDISSFSDSNIELKLLMRGEKPNPKLAYFDMNNLKEDSREFSFKLYADVLFPLLRSGNLNPLKSIWIHEIMHLIDYRELLKNLKIYREKMEVINYNNNPLFNHHLRKDKHIILLELMMHFRAEGIATLVQYAMGGSNPGLMPPTKADKKFIEIISNVVSLIHTIDFDSRQLFDYIEKVSPLAYLMGAGIVLSGLMKKVSPE